MENLIINGSITNTSKKQGNDFESKTKTAYLSVDEENSKKLQEFGLTKYTSKEDKEDFFIVKLVDKLVAWVGDEHIDLSHLSKLDTDNFKVDSIQMNIIKSENKGNTFFRIQALNLPSEDHIELMEPENPFGESMPF